LLRHDNRGMHRETTQASHAPGPPLQAPVRHRAWRILLAGLAGLVCWLAFSPQPPPQADTGWDKLNHMLAFAALAFCAWRGFATSARRLAGVPLALMAYGAVIELVQSRIPGRSGEWPDLLADAVGIAAGMALAAAGSRRPRLANADFDRLTP
jgi:VanZ family protein